MSGGQNYHRMSVAEKQAYARATVREPAVMCPACDAQTTAADLLEHVDKRCQGPREPGPGSKWVTWPEALALGVTRWMLSRWAISGDVRFRGGKRERQYLLRDIAIRLAADDVIDNRKNAITFRTRRPRQRSRKNAITRNDARLGSPGSSCLPAKTSSDSRKNAITRNDARRGLRGLTRSRRDDRSAGMWNLFRRRRPRATDLILERLDTMTADLTALKNSVASLQTAVAGVQPVLQAKVKSLYLCKCLTGEHEFVVHAASAA